MPYPQLQQPAPFFRSQAAINGDFREICLTDYRGRYLVLFFYPLDFTFVCPTEIVAFSDAADKFREINCEVIACSTDSHYCHLAWVNTPRKEGGLGPMDIPLLSDKTMVISKAYGVLKEDDGYPFRGLFIIDTEGVLRQIIVNDIGVGRSVDEVMRLVQANQFVDLHGEVCPVGWKPGEAGVPMDSDKSKGYFAVSHK